MKQHAYSISIFTLVILFFSVSPCMAQLNTKASAGASERLYLVNTLTKIADPVLLALKENRLKKDMPVESSVKNREHLAGCWRAWPPGWNLGLTKLLKERSGRNIFNWRLPVWIMPPIQQLQTS